MPAATRSKVTPKKRARSSSPETPAPSTAVAINSCTPHERAILDAFKKDALTRGVDIDSLSTSPADAVANLRSAFDSTRESKENSSLDKLAAVIAGLKPAEPAEGAMSLGAALDKLASTLVGAMSKNSEPSKNKIAAQSATKERQKLTFTFHKDLIEAIILLHTAARSSELEGDHLPAA